MNKKKLEHHCPTTGSGVHLPRGNNITASRDVFTTREKTNDITSKHDNTIHRVTRFQLFQES